MILLFVGCSNSASKPALTFSTESVEGAFNVDGTNYGYNGGYAKEETAGKILCSVVIVYPKEEETYGYSLLDISEMDGIYRASVVERMIDKPIIHLSTNRVYFHKDGKSTMAKTNEELKIDLSDPSFFTSQKLEPILEKFVRENVKTKE